MAFVFQTQRWKEVPPVQQVGPGYYKSQIKPKLKGGVISPDHSTHHDKKSPKQYTAMSSNQQSLHIQRQFQNIKTICHQQSKKLFKRTMSAKPGSLKKQFNENPTIFKAKDPNINFQITNSNIHQKKSFQNSIIKTSFKKPKKSIHSQTQNIVNKKPFNDKNMRTFETNKSQIESQKKQNIDFFNNLFAKPHQNSNPNLVKFVQSKTKKQNFFVSSQKPSFINQNQNFIIASGNCKKDIIRPSSTTTPYKDTCSLAKLDTCDDIQTTGIQDSLDSSFEYITDATPGPGEYQLRKQISFQKSKVQKFGITQKRFKEKIKNQKILDLNVEAPSFKKSSKASQQKVAFGKNRPKTAKQTSSDFLFYEDQHTIQNKCIQNLIKDREAPGTFLSKCDRFRKMKREAYFGPDFFQKEKPNPVTLPNSIFMSKVDRHQRPLSPTADIDYQGQNYKTIEQKAQKFKQKKQILDSQVPGFYISEPRFKYKSRQQSHQQIKPISTNGSKNKKQYRSYTFRKDQKRSQDENIQNPAPWTYNLQMKWVKPSHHVRFKF